MRGSYLLGIACILAVALIWSASSVLVQALFTSADFRRPVFLTWVANSLFMITLPLRALVLVLRQTFCSGYESQPSDAAARDEPRRGMLTITPAMRVAMRAGLRVAPVWFAANCTYNISMAMTSITSTTVISSSSVAFTLILSVVWLRERVTALKLVGVALCIIGNVLTAVGDEAGAPPANATNATPAGGGGGGAAAAHFGGDAICLLSAALYACYTVLIRRLAPPDLALFFGFLGLFTFALFGPLVALLHLSGVEDLAALTPAIGGLLLLKGLFDNVLSDYLWAAAVLLTSPSVATIGMSLTVPLAILSDVSLPPSWLVDPSTPTPLSVVAAVAVIGGFVAITAAGGGGDGSGVRGDCDVSMRVPLLAPRGREDRAVDELRPAAEEQDADADDDCSRSPGERRA